MKNYLIKLKKNFLLESFLVLALGSLSSLSLPPLNFFFINFFTLSFFFSFLFKKLIQQKTIKSFFYFGWLFGFSYFLTNLYWITISLSFDVSYSYLIPVSLILLPASLALFYGIITSLFFWFNPKNILSAFFSFSLIFGSIEFIRGIILTGFPWNLFVYSFSENLNFISIISIIGTYSLNLIVISFFTLPALYILRKTNREMLVCIFFLLLPILFFTHGNFQKKEFLSNIEKENPYLIRIIASNISLERYYKSAQTEKVIDELIKISSPEKKKNILFIWPEGIIPDTYQDEFYLYKDIIINSFDENHLIGLGITRRESRNDKNNYYNSFSLFDNNLNLISKYDKINLVPFGEFLPIENILNKIGLKTITGNIGSFTRGDERKILKIQKDGMELKFLPLICYEIIYSGSLTNSSDFDFILNISEDGWFGKSIGPKQHFTHSIFRAIENGKYVLRSSNNGMAAIINPLGQIEKKIDYGISNYIDFERSKDFGKTIFSTYGNKIFMVLILLYIFLAISFNRSSDE